MLAGKIFFELRNLSSKNALKFPELFRSLCGACESPANFPQNYPVKKQENSPTSFCRRAGRTSLRWKIASESRCEIVVHSEWPWLFAQKPFDPPNRPNPKFSRNPALPRNPPGIPTEFILSAIQNPTEFHWIPLNFSEISRNFPNFPEFAHIPPNPWNFRKIRGGEEFTQSGKWPWFRFRWVRRKRNVHCLDLSGHYSREWSECTGVNEASEWSIRLWLPSAHVNWQNEPSCCKKNEWRGNQWSICPWTDQSEHHKGFLKTGVSFLSLM